MDMKSSWMQTRNSSSFWPPVANEKRRRDWMMYLKMYSLAWRDKQKNCFHFVINVWIPDATEVARGAKAAAAAEGG